MASETLVGVLMSQDTDNVMIDGRIFEGDGITSLVIAPQFSNSQLGGYLSVGGTFGRSEDEKQKDEENKDFKNSMSYRVANLGVTYSPISNVTFLGGVGYAQSEGKYYHNIQYDNRNRVTFDTSHTKKDRGINYNGGINLSYDNFGVIAMYDSYPKVFSVGISYKYGNTSNNRYKRLQPTYYKGSIEAAKAQIAINENELSSRIKTVEGKKILNFNRYRIVDQKPFAFNMKDAQSVNKLKSDELLMFDFAFWDYVIQKSISTPNIDKKKQKRLIQKELNTRYSNSNIDWELYRSIAFVGGLVVAGTLAVQSLESDSTSEFQEEENNYKKENQAQNTNDDIDMDVPQSSTPCSYKLNRIRNTDTQNKSQGKQLKCSNGKYVTVALYYKNNKWKEEAEIFLPRWFDTFDEVANHVCGCD